MAPGGGLYVIRDLDLNLGSGGNIRCTCVLNIRYPEEGPMVLPQPHDFGCVGEAYAVAYLEEGPMVLKVQILVSNDSIIRVFA